MESNTFTPQFGVGYEMGSFLVASGLLLNAWEASSDAYQSEKPFIVKNSEDDDYVFVAFPGTRNVKDIITDSNFGECEISRDNENKHLFPSLKESTNDKPALVHKGFLIRFLEILRSPELKTEVQKAQGENKRIVFAGHSLGGAIASLATLWILEKRHECKAAPFCVTFGSPLVGDKTLSQAIRREKWSGQFFHVVSRHDIVSRILLAPSKSISKPLAALIPYWWKSMNSTAKNIDKRDPLSEEEKSSLLTSVLKHASALANYVTVAYRASTNIVFGEVNNLVKQSPYRPFGCYVFCSKSGAACIDNHEAILQMLYYTLQSSDASPDRTAHACISEHTEYGSTMQQIIQGLASVGGPAELVISDTKSPYELGTSLQLQALGLGIKNVQEVQARLALRAAGEGESRRNKNNARKAGELGNVQAAMVEIERYKKSCKASGVGYYDSFKMHNDERDFNANLARLKLAGFWDEIIEMVELHELPDDFEAQNKWINAGTAYRRLVEPLDIANYYRLGKHEDSGHYLSNGRPRRYKTLEKWLHEKERIRKSEPKRRRSRPASLTIDSCFWAYLEEVRDSLGDSQDFEKHVKQQIKSFGLSEDILLENSSFIKWWEMLTPQHKSVSPLFEFMREEGWKKYPLPEKLSG
eukprot:Gb_40574 [translate_table: standard]